MKINFEDFGLLLLRVGFSSLLLTHGFGKLMSLLKGDFSFPDPIGVGAVPSLVFAVLGEVIAPVLIIIGFRVKLSALFPIVTMFVATFVFHAGHSFAKKELALLYLIGFLVIFLCGPGKYAVDNK